MQPNNCIGWRITFRLFGLTWATAFICEFSSTRIGIPFGDYFDTGSTEGQELYISSILFMDSHSFSFLWFAGYCVALVFVLPHAKMVGQPGRVALRFKATNLLACVRAHGRVVHLFGCHY